MKAALLCLLALTAVAAASSSASYEKVNLGASFLSSMVRRTLLGRQEDVECEGLCIIHYAEPDGCGVGYVLTECEEGQISLGQFEDDCHCCIPNPELEEDPEADPEEEEE